MTAEAAEILQDIRDHLERVASPWKNRRAAAVYCGCKPATIDRARAQGKIRARKGTGVPVFHRDELDAWVEGKQKGNNHHENELSECAGESGR